MRIARVLIADAPTPQVALERDGCLYDVEALEERWQTRFAPDRFAGAGDFHIRVIALGCAGLADLDARLRAGERPTEARLGKDAFVWCAPFDDRATYVQLDGHGSDGAPRYRIGSSRAIVGHDAPLLFSASESRFEARLEVGVVLRDDLVRATAIEARAALLGFALLDDWTALDALERSRAAGRGDAPARDAVTQLGPVLVTLDEAEPLASLRARVRVDDQVVFDGALDLDLDDLAADLAALSRELELRAGDLIGAGLDRARVTASRGARVEILVERLGRLAGQP